MSIFTKPVSQLNTDDLRELLNNGAVENVLLEFKLLVPNKEETLKKISSFGNTFGGFVVIGAKADSADGRIQDLPGVDIEPGYKQKVVQWCFDGASPPLVVEVSDPIPAPAGDSKVCYVIHIAESDVAPHFLNGRKGVWIRTDEFSTRYDAQLANEVELRHLLDRRRLVRERRDRILERARKRFDVYIAKMHTDKGGNRTKVGPVLEFAVVPRFPALQLCRHEEFREYILKSYVNWRQVMFPNPGQPILFQHESAIILNPVRQESIFEVNVWGLLFYAVQIESTHGEIEGIHPFELVGYVLVFIEHAAKMLNALGYSGPILIDAALRSILNAMWFRTYQGGVISADTGSELDDVVDFSVSTTSEALTKRPDAVAMEVLRYIFLSVNWPGMVETSKELENLIRIGYQYNFWPKPTTLRI